MIIRVSLDCIRDNPYQPRQVYDDIEELAEKIHTLKDDLPGTLGLIHPPNARLVDTRGNPIHFAGTLPPGGDWAVQIAEGHRRLRAFQSLAVDDPDYREMPVSLANLDDQTMDDIAWDENAERKDLSPVEEARALKRTMERFDLTQAALAERRRLGRSTVANKLRLLQLPDDMLEAIHDGRLTERHGTAYLPLQDLKPADLEVASTSLIEHVDFGSWHSPHPDTLRERLVKRSDLTADEVRATVERIKRTVEQAKKRKWEVEQRRREAETTPAPASAPIPPPTPSKPPPDMKPAPEPQPPQKLDMPPKEELVDLPDVVVTIRFPRGKLVRPETFTLSAGEDGQFPQLMRGNFPGELYDTLKHAMSLFFPLDPEQGEQILMELEATDD